MKGRKWVADRCSGLRGVRTFLNFCLLQLVGEILLQLLLVACGEGVEEGLLALLRLLSEWRVHG